MIAVRPLPPLHPSPLLRWALTILSDNDNLSIPLTGLLLFESQFQSITHHRLASNPLFLRLLLRYPLFTHPLLLSDQSPRHRATYWAVHRGYSLWKIFEGLDRVDDVEKLYDHILTLFEKGFHFTSKHAEEARQLCLEAGSLDGLRAQHPWHPAFQNTLQPMTPGDPVSGSLHGHRHHSPVTATEFLGIDFHYSSVASTGGSDRSAPVATSVVPNSRSHRHGSVLINPSAAAALSGVGGRAPCWSLSSRTSLLNLSRGPVEDRFATSRREIGFHSKRHLARNGLHRQESQGTCRQGADQICGCHSPGPAGYSFLLLPL